MRHVFIAFIIVLFGGCALKSPSGRPEIYDLAHIPQDVTYFAKNLDDNVSLYEIQKKHDSFYFSVWDMERPKEDIESVKWPFSAFRPATSYGENLQPLEQSFFDAMLSSANFQEYATVNTKGVTLREVNLRAFPTLRPLLKDPSLAGEGFPFDYLQNSTLHANTPVLISHYSKNGEWAYIFASFASGWVRTHEFVILEEEQRDFWQKAKQVAIAKEGEAIYDAHGSFLFLSKIGMLLPLVSEDETTYTVAAAISTAGPKASLVNAKISKEIAVKEVMKLDRDNLTAIINEVSKTNYGWGGIYEQRDCSSTLRDLFTPFGIWLPRNSYQQSMVGEVLSLEGLNDDEKVKTIKENAVPFQTLLYKKGHVVLYVGTYDDEVIVFHNVWGIKTKKNGTEGRFVIGKTIFSTLRLGKEQEDYDEEYELLRNILSMNIITRKRINFAQKQNNMSGYKFKK